MAIVNFENLPSENTPLTGGATGNLNVMQENGTSHGTDTKLGYSQAFLNDHLVNISNEVDEDYRVNFVKSKNLLSTSLELGTFTNSGVKDTSPTNYRTANMVKAKPNTTYTTSINGIAQAYALYFYTAGGVYISSSTTATFTTPANCEYLNFRCFNADFTSDFNNLKIQLEEGNEATAYSSFIQNQIIVDDEKYTDTLNVGSVVDNRSRVNVLYSKNLFDKDNWYKSYIDPTNGNIASSNNAALFNYIKVKSSTIYSLKLDTNVLDLKVAYYTNNYTWISSSNTITTSTTITIPNNCEYIRIYINVDGNGINQTKIDNLQFMVNEGSTALPYEPYITPSIYVDNEMLVSKNVYSTGEVVIGEWLGKPLYRKVFTITSLTSSNTNLVDVSGLSIDFAKISGTIITSTGAKFPINLYDSASNYSVIIISDAGYIRGRGAIGSGTLSKCIVILEYTKTTDV